MVQISKAEPLATNKETVVSPEVLELVGSKILWEPRELEGQTFGKLLGLAPRFIGIPSPPPLEKIPLSDDDVDLLKRFIPPAVFKRLASGYNVFLNELRE
ncbi:MAG: hypothetical protein KVP17_000207 [Porospora cf. gigantea B]|nr:MAG: hypothetical protein KVP17_000207 [Porospora cf. gigantea B]